jgi:hypothetical protein
MFFLVAENELEVTEEHVEVPRAVYDAFVGFLKAKDRPSGNIAIDFKNGGIAGVKSTVTKIHK